MTLKPLRSAGRITPATLQQFRIADLHITEQDETAPARRRRAATRWLEAVPAKVRAEAVATFVAL